MNRDEAIAILQESLRQNKAIEESPNVFFSSKNIVGGALKNIRRRTTALEMAIDALRTQQTPAKLDRSRWKGCYLCKDATYLGGDVCVSGTHYVGVSEFDFCPNCGRPLTEEALAELERKIF